jgi:hypothetical protein
VSAVTIHRPGRGILGPDYRWDVYGDEGRVSHIVTRGTFDRLGRETADTFTRDMLLPKEIAECETALAGRTEEAYAEWIEGLAS